MQKDIVGKRLIHYFVGGSHLYGTSTPESDKDYRGVCLMPKTALLGLSPFEQYQEHNELHDIEVYGLIKFIKLALDANPNILDILFCPPDRWLVTSDYWQAIYHQRHAFLSEKVRYTFSGYAMAQLKRLNGHRKWLLDPPDHQPTPEEYNCWIENTPNGGQLIRYAFDYDKTEYNAAKLKWDNYQQWLRERNPKRAAMERITGYDCKHAAHLARLLMKVKSILIQCDYNPILSGVHLEWTLAIRNGDVDYESLMEFVNELDAEIKTIKTELPNKPDFNAIESLLIALNLRSLNDADYQPTRLVTFGQDNLIPLTL